MSEQGIIGAAADNVVGIVGATVSIGRYIVNDYVITLAPIEGDYGYTMTITRGSDTQTVTLYGLSTEQYNSMLGYLQQAQEAAQSAAGSANDAADYMGVALDAANRANSKAASAEQSSNTARGYATQAETAKQGAETAKTDAIAAKDIAVNMQRNAEFFATRAETAATNAGNAQTAAEAAQTAAEAAQTAAETAETNAQTYAGQAQQSATNAGQSAASAVQTLSQVQTEGAAQIAAVDAEGQRVLASIPADYSQMEADVTDLKSQTDAIEAATVVFTEPTNLLHGTITNGYIINADGSITTRSEYSYTDYIEIDSSKGYIAFTRQATATTRTMDGMTVAFYNANKSFISRLDGNVKTIPGNAAYIRQNIITTYLSNVYKPMIEYVNSTGSNIASTYSDWFEPYYALLANYGANFKNRKICVYGDSLAANGNGGDNAWINILADKLQFKGVYNRGIGGSRITDTETRYAYVDVDGDAYNRSSYATQQTVPTGYTEINPCMSLSERINTIPTDTDILIVLAGANDASGVTLDAIKTAYATMLDGIYARVPNARVLLGTLLYNHNWDGNESEQIVEKYNDIRSIIKDMGALYGYPIIDFKGTMGVNNRNYAEYMDSDGVHYTTKNKGKNRIAEVAIPRVFDIKYIN